MLTAPLGRISSAYPVSEISTLVSIEIRLLASRFTFAGPSSSVSWSSTDGDGDGSRSPVSAVSTWRRPLVGRAASRAHITSIATDASAAGRIARSLRARHAQPAPMAAARSAARLVSRFESLAHSHSPSLCHVSSRHVAVSPRHSVSLTVSHVSRCHGARPMSRCPPDVSAPLRLLALGGCPRRWTVDDPTAPRVRTRRSVDWRARGRRHWRRPSGSRRS